MLIPVFVSRDYNPVNELKYISIADEALRNGTWFTFYNHGEMYADKPPLYFWFVMLSKLATGNHYMWLIGLLSLLPSFGIMAVMDRWMKNEGKIFNPVVANLMLLTTAMFLGATIIVRMDMLMGFFVVLSLYKFYAIYKGKHTAADKYLLSLYLFLALFAKGAMGLAIPVVSIVVFLAMKKQIRTIGRYLGWRQLLLLSGLCILWFTFVYAEGGREYLNNLVFHQTLDRGINSFHHKGPFWFYILRMLFTFAPWSLLFIVLVWRGIRGKMLNDDMERFFLTIICSTVAMLSVISSKLDIYLLPVYPFVVYLCSILLAKDADNAGVRIAIGIPAALLILALPAAVVLMDIAPGLRDHSPFIYGGAAILAAGGVTAIAMLFREQVLKAVGAVCVGIVGFLFVGSFAMPSINKYIGFGEMAKSTAEVLNEDENVGFAYYKFDVASNMDVYLNCTVREVYTIDKLDSIAESGRKTILFVRDREIRRDDKFADWIARYKPQWTFGEYSWYLITGQQQLLNPLHLPRSYSRK